MPFRTDTLDNINNKGKPRYTTAYLLLIALMWKILLKLPLPQLINARSMVTNY